LPCHRSDGVLVRYDPKLVGKHRWPQRYGLGGLAERFDQEQAGRGYKTALSSSESGFRRASSRCLVRRGFYPWRRLIVPHFEHASRHLDFVSGTPSSHKGGSRASSPDPRHRNSRRHPLSREPSPSCGTSIRIRTGKRRSASAIMNPELLLPLKIYAMPDTAFQCSLIDKPSNDEILKR
jgi:hypothetical protein